MTRTVSSFELSLKNRPPHLKLTNWLYEELRNAMLEGRLEAGARLPASRDFARQYGLSRGTVVSVFERLLDEGYISSRVGMGTWINRVLAVPPQKPATPSPPAYIQNVIATYVRPKPYVDLVWKGESLPFRASDPAIAEFPSEVWDVSRQSGLGISGRGLTHRQMVLVINHCATRSPIIYAHHAERDALQNRSLSSPGYSRHSTCWHVFF